MVFEIKQPKEPKKDKEVNLLKMDYPSWNVEPSKAKKEETSLLSMDYPTETKMFEVEQPEGKEAKQEKATPIYNIDMSKYPQKDRLQTAIRKTNEFFKEKGEVYVYDEVRTSNIESFFNEDGTKNWQKIYEYYVDRFYRDPDEMI